jgi:hypothetical protein
MKEKIQENNLRVNRASKKALAELKQVINPEQLYCLQMMTWGLDLIDDQDGRLKSTVQEMPSWKPENAMKYLTTMDGQPISPVNWSKVKDPEDLALELLSTLNDQLTLTLPAYPSKMYRRRT